MHILVIFYRVSFVGPEIRVFALAIFQTRQRRFELNLSLSVRVYALLYFPFILSLPIVAKTFKFSRRHNSFSVVFLSFGYIFIANALKPNDARWHSVMLPTTHLTHCPFYFRLISRHCMLSASERSRARQMTNSFR